MNGLISVINFVRDRLLLARKALERGDRETAARELEAAGERLNEARDELSDDEPTA